MSVRVESSFVPSTPASSHLGTRFMGEFPELLNLQELRRLSKMEEEGDEEEAEEGVEEKEREEEEKINIRW